MSTLDVTKSTTDGTDTTALPAAGNARIVSLLPGATEMAFALGLGDVVVGVSHECDFPQAARSLPAVVRPALALEQMTQRQIDVAYRGAS